MDKQTDVVSPKEAESILREGALLLRISRSDIEIIQKLDDWWFVPRSAQGIDLWKKRMPQTLALYEETGELPAYFREAYEFLVSDQYQEILEMIAAAESELQQTGVILAA